MRPNNNKNKRWNRRPHSIANREIKDKKKKEKKKKKRRKKNNTCPAMSPKYTSESHKYGLLCMVLLMYVTTIEHESKKSTANYVSNTFGAWNNGQDHPVWLESVQRPRRYNHAKFNKAKNHPVWLESVQRPRRYNHAKFNKARSPSLAWVGTKTPAL